MQPLRPVTQRVEALQRRAADLWPVAFTIAKGNQTVSFGAAPATVVVNTGASTGSVSATATSDWPWHSKHTAHLFGECRYGSGNWLDCRNMYHCHKQAGNANYNAAPGPVTQSFAVGAGSQAISFGAAPAVIVGGTGTVSATGGASTSPVVLSVPTTTAVCQSRALP